VKNRPGILGAIASAIWVSAVAAADVQVFPRDGPVLAPLNPQRGYFDLMVPTVTIHTRPGEQFRADLVQMELRKGSRIVAMRAFSPAEIVAKTKALASQPVQGLVDVQFVGAGGLKPALGAGARFATSATLAPDEVLALTEAYFALDDAPDRLHVTVTGADGKGATRVYETSVPIARYRSAIAYRLPLRGNWLEAEGSGPQSHHRFNAPAEFAADFFKVDTAGHDYHDDSAKAENWYAWGEPVMAAADGEVVRVVADQVQDRAFLAHRPGETDAQRAARVGRTMEERLFGKTARIPASMIGNMVTIRHEGQGQVEYSSYAHLQPGSIRVKPGDRVRQGDIIAAVGDTGDTPVVHLHFQVNAGPDPFNDKSLPFTLSDVKWAGATRDPAHFVEPAPASPDAPSAAGKAGGAAPAR
jgi:murein DD-endopeptidase MepM/ murein hydrolase activator NlpD